MEYGESRRVLVEYGERTSKRKFKKVVSVLSSSSRLYMIPFTSHQLPYLADSWISFQSSFHSSTVNPLSKMAARVSDEKADIARHKEIPSKDHAGPGDYSGAVGKTDPAEIALVRKLDMRIMPTLWATYFMNYLDRNAIANARLGGLEDDLGLVGSQYNTCISILFEDGAEDCRVTDICSCRSLRIC